MSYTAEDILKEREKRVEIQNKLMDKFNKTLVCLKVNFPGVNKENELSTAIFNDVSADLEAKFSNKLLLKLFRITAEGLTEIFIIDEEPLRVKEGTLNIEETHPLGRFTDIDVYNPRTKESISRGQLGYSPRKCYICENSAYECVRSAKHTYNETVDAMKKTYSEYRGSIK